MYDKTHYNKKKKKEEEERNWIKQEEYIFVIKLFPNYLWMFHMHQDLYFLKLRSKYFRLSFGESLSMLKKMNTTSQSQDYSINNYHLQSS